MSIDKTRGREARLIHHVQDAWTVGEHNGFEFVKVKLDSTTHPFSKEEMDKADAQMITVKFLERAAKNTFKITELKEQLNYTETALETEREAKANMRSVLDRAASALGQKPLTQPEEVKLKGVWREKIKTWFTLPQFGTAIIGFLVAPQILTVISSYTGVMYEYPTSSIILAAITAFGFFSIPIFKKMFGRWL